MALLIKNRLLLLFFILYLQSCSIGNFSSTIRGVSKFYTLDKSSQILLFEDKSIEIREIQASGVAKCRGDWYFLGRNKIIFNCSNVSSLEGELAKLTPYLEVPQDTIYILSRTKLEYSSIEYRRSTKEFNW